MKPARIVCVGLLLILNNVAVLCAYLLQIGLYDLITHQQIIRTHMILDASYSQLSHSLVNLANIEVKEIHKNKK